MNVLFLSSEVTPYAKTGGLADVAGSLPGALKRLGVDVSVGLPLYRSVREGAFQRQLVLKGLQVPLAGQSLVGNVHATETQEGAPVYLFAWPDEANGRNAIEIGAIPGALSLLTKHDIDAEIKGLRDFPPDERPPVLLTSFAFKGMVGLGCVFILLTVIGVFKRNKLLESPLYLKAMLYAIPLPYLAVQLGWLLTEVGRQPWIVYGLIRTSEAVSPVSATQVALSLAGFVLVYTLLGAAGFSLIAKYARKGPEIDDGAGDVRPRTAVRPAAA
jgi:cytochrome d ubiquinol oxidase subunit I